MKHHYKIYGLDKRQRRRYIRRNDLKNCNCWSPYVDIHGFVWHYEDCRVIQRKLGLA